EIFSQTQINKYFHTTNLQIEITRCFYDHQKELPPETQRLSLFRKTAEKREISETLLIIYNFDLAFKVIVDNRLPFAEICGHAVRQIALKKQHNKIQALLKQFKGTITNEEWDEIVLAIIKVYSEDLKDKKSAEKYVARINSTSSKVYGYIVC